MPLEIEAKFRIADRQRLIDQLHAQGAHPGALVRELDTYFDTADASLGRSDQGLRVRIETQLDPQTLVDRGPVRTIITHKGPRQPGPFKTRNESELDCSDAAAATRLLIALGYHPHLGFEKIRCQYHLHDCIVALDTLPQLGSFVEIEGPRTTSVEQVRHQLGLDHEPHLTQSYIAMVAAHLQQQAPTTRVLRFD